MAQTGRDKLKIMVKIGLIILLLCGLIGLFGLAGHQLVSKNAKMTMVASSFPGYDFLRELTRGDDSAEIKMLLIPGGEMHSFEPTPEDIKNIQNSKLFVYVGGESDKWIDGIISNLDLNKTKITRLVDLVETVAEEHVDGMEENGHDEDALEKDEHVWTNPVNAIEIIQKLKDALVQIDPEKKDFYEQNANRYIAELNQLDAEIQKLVETAKRKEIIVGDRFPLRYFVDKYGLSYYAAFPGCSEQTEASAKTISFLIDKVREDSIPVVFHMELSNGKIAEAVARETGAKVLEINSAHNISQEDFDKGLTYLDIMKNNIKVLKEALN
ncbi:MAG: metal ABC transporter substrate-binding protein [Candidatus Saccharibacteria bacterium]|nr:metal ABC transporter substrate-binding protein [Candidatus Saccharibacteria bacterium]